jgi:hypothetical protein
MQVVLHGQRRGALDAQEQDLIVVDLRCVLMSWAVASKNEYCGMPPASNVHLSCVSTMAWL